MLLSKTRFRFLISVDKFDYNCCNKKEGLSYPKPLLDLRDTPILSSILLVSTVSELIL